MPPIPPPADGDYVLTWTVLGPPPSVQSVTYRVTGGRIETPWGGMTWSSLEGVFFHETLPIGLECTGAGTFTGTSPGLSTVGECYRKP